MEPEIGMGVTEYQFTDSRALTIVEIISPKKLIIQRDIAKRTDQNGMSEDQRWEFSPDINGEKIIITKRKDDKWYRLGDNTNHFVLGERREYFDFSF